MCVFLVIVNKGVNVIKNLLFNLKIQVFLWKGRIGWMDERCLRPLFCTIKAELGRGQPGLMR